MAEFDTTKFLAHHVDLGQKLSSVFEDDSESLSHYQIKGAKHGVRRFQNPDGSLTPEGRIRYGVGEKRKTNGSSTEKLYDKVKKAHDKSKEAIRQKSRNMLKEYLRDHPKQLIKFKRVITEDEANEIIKKIEFDKKLRAVRDDELKRGTERIKRIQEKTDNFSKIMVNSRNMWNIAANTHNCLLKSGHIKNSKPWTVIKG